MIFLYISMVKLFMIGYFCMVLHFTLHQKTIVVSLKIQIPGKIGLTKSLQALFCFEPFFKFHSVSISSFSGNKREGGEEGEIQKRRE